VTAEEQCVIVRPHTYLSSTRHEYRTCFLCKVRKSMVCVKCGSCLLCHPSTERIETRKPVFYTGIAMLLDIESPALAEIKRWARYLLCLNRSRVKAGFQQWDQKDMHVIFMSLLIEICLLWSKFRQLRLSRCKKLWLQWWTFVIEYVGKR